MIKMTTQVKKKTYRELERIAKGVANHRRIQILEVLQTTPELSVLDIASALRMNFKTASEHIRRLAIAGLIMKRSDWRNVRHKPTPRGSLILKFLRTLE